MKRLFELKDISTYRAELMGWAIVWIMMLHFTFTQIKPLGFRNFHVRIGLWPFFFA